MNVRTWLAMAIVTALAIGIGLWGIVFFLEAAAVYVLVIAAVAVRNWWRRGGREMDQAVALVCKPCNGEAGRCTCTGKCGNWLCGAGDTSISDERFSRELAEWLKGDGRG